MIVDIDHIALSSDNIERDIAILKRLLYNNLFVKKGLVDLSIKKYMMTSFSGKLDMAFCESIQNFNIELINHGNCSENDGYIIPILENLPIDIVSEEKEHKMLNDEDIFETVLLSNMARVYAIEKKGSFTLNKVIVKTNDLKRSFLFWKALGFKKKSESKNSITLTFKSFLSSSYWIYLNEEQDIKEYNLNDRGFNCIALISTDIKKEWEILSDEGYYTTNIETMKPDKKELLIFFVRGPGGELVEFIGLRK